MKSKLTVRRELNRLVRSEKNIKDPVEASKASMVLALRWVMDDGTHGTLQPSRIIEMMEQVSKLHTNRKGITNGF